MITKRHIWYLTILTIFALLLAACGGAATEAPAAEEPAAEEPAEEPMEEPMEESMEKVKITIFVGLGTGTDPDQIDAQNALAEKFNASHDDIEIEFLITPYDEAPERLVAMIAGGEPPDLLGPGGVDVVGTYLDQIADIQPFIDGESFDMSDFYGAAVDLYQLPEKTVGLPLGMFPSFIFYNIDLFDAAGVDYPTHDYGDTSWNHTALREMAMQLTLDANGNNATSPDFDPNNIVQYGFDDSWTDPRGFTASFDPPGKGRPLSDDLKTALFDSEEYKEALAWLNAAIWEDHFMGDLTVQQARDATGVDPFGPGTTAMFHSHTWFMPEGLVDLTFDYDFAPVPYNAKGTRISRIHADSFYMLEDSRHKEEAWVVMKWITSPENIIDVCLIYGCLPARQSVSDAYLLQFIDRYGEDHDYDVIFTAIDYLDAPHHESWMPNNDRVWETMYAEIHERVYTEPVADTDALLEEVNGKIQGLIDDYWAGQ